MSTDSYICVRPVRALQYDGTRASADRIAEAFGLTVVVQADRLAAAFRVPLGWSIDVEEYDHETREFGVSTGGWVWWDKEARAVGAEWDEYFRENYVSAQDHSTPACRCGERDLGTSHAPAVAQPDPGGEAGSGLNFQEAAQ